MDFGLYMAGTACALTDGSTFLLEMMQRRPSWKCDVKSKIRLCQ